MIPAQGLGIPGLWDAEGTATGEAALSRAALTVPAVQGTLLQGTLEPQMSPRPLCSHRLWSSCWRASSRLQVPCISQGWDLCSLQAARVLPCLECLRLLESTDALTGPRSPLRPTVHSSTCATLGAALLLEATGEDRALNPRRVLPTGGSTIPSGAPRRDQEPGKRPGRRKRQSCSGAAAPAG